MSEEEWSGRPGQLAIDYRFCYGFHLTLFYGNRRMKFWSWIFQSSGKSAFMHSADCFSGIGKGGLYSPIERTMLTIIAAMAAGITLSIPDEKLTAFLELESGKEGASGWLQQRGQMTRARSRSSRKLCACVTSRNSSGVR